jgi:pyruvate dehydrogenase E1 component alpha subunit
MAAIWNLPVVFVCENNQYGMSMSTQRSMHNQTIAQRATAYGIPGERVDGNDVLAVYAAVYKAAEHARTGQGPTLIEAFTYRYKGHSKSDQNRYRTRDEIREWQQQDPIQRLGALLTEQNIANQQDIQQIEAAAYQTIEDAYQFALSGPNPDPETLLEGVYA